MRRLVRLLSPLCSPPTPSPLSTSAPCGVAPKPTKPSPTSVDLTLSYISYENPKYEGTQTSLVLQHGMFGTKENFKQLGKQLHHITKRSMIIPDIRNHGSSLRSTKMSVKQMSVDLVRTVQHLLPGGEQVCVMGHATGGRLAMMTALTKPELVDRLVVVATSPLNTKASVARWETSRQACYIVNSMVKSWAEREGRNESEVGGVKFKLELDSALKSVLPDSAQRALLISNLGKVNLNAFLNNPDLGVFPTLEGHTFNGPTLFICGGRDPAWEGDEEVRQIRRLFPNSHFAQIPGSGQLVHQTEEFLETSVTFLQTKL